MRKAELIIPCNMWKLVAMENVELSTPSEVVNDVS